MVLTRRCWAEIFYKNKNIWETLKPYISSIEIEDNLEGQLDSIKLTLVNKNNVFLQKGWSFEKGETLLFFLNTLNWERENEGIKGSKLGTFFIDEKEFTKDYAEIKGISAPLNAMNVVHSKTWQSITLQSLGKEIADKYKLEYLYKVSFNPILKNLKQEKETDFAYLNKIAQEEGVKLKITHNSLLLFEESEMTKKTIVANVDLSKVIDYRIVDKTNDIYDAVEVSFFEKKKLKAKKIILSENQLRGGKNKEYTKVLKITRKPNSEDLKKYCLKKLEQVNKNRKTLEYDEVGNINIYAGVIVNIINSGVYNGKYLVTKVTKTLPDFRNKVVAYKIEEE